MAAEETKMLEVTKVLTPTFSMKIKNESYHKTSLNRVGVIKIIRYMI